MKRILRATILFMGLFMGLAIMTAACSSMKSVKVLMDLPPQIELKSKGVQRMVILPFKGKQGLIVSRKIAGILSRRNYFTIKDNSNKQVINEEFKLLLDIDSGADMDMIEDKLESLGADAVIAGIIEPVKWDQGLKSKAWKEKVPVYDLKTGKIKRTKTVYHKTWERTGWCRVVMHFRVTDIKTQDLLVQQEISKRKDYYIKKIDERPDKFPVAAMCDPVWEQVYAQFEVMMTPHKQWVEFRFFKVETPENARALAFVEVKKWGMAENEWNEALKNEALEKCDLAKLLYNLSVIHEVTGDTVQYAKTLDNAFELCPTNDAIKAAVAR